jgi:D-aspartate ligase
MRPVVLLGGLNIVRALGMAGIPVIIASSDRRTPSMASRYCTGVLELPPLSRREEVVETLVRAGKRLTAEHGAKPPLFYDNDDRLELVQECRARLEPHFALLLNDWALAAALLDKGRFQALAEREGLPVPRRIAWEALVAERGPVLVKPRLRTAWEDSSVLRHLFGGVGKARVFESGKAALADPLVGEFASQLAFQEYIPGGDGSIWSFHGFSAPGGKVLASFVGRKIRTFPELTGDSSYLELAHDDGLAALGRSIAMRLRLAGVFKMDFKRSSATGRFHLLEVNPRVNLWHYVGAVNGVNLPAVAYSYLTGNPVAETSRAKDRYRWLSLRLDWQAFKTREDLGWVRWLWSLAQAPKVYDLFAWSDPGPFLRRLAQRASRRLLRLRPWPLPAK